MVKSVVLVKLVVLVELVKLVSVHFFDIRTPKKGSTQAVLDTFGFQMCFAPQWRALFRHLSVKKWSEPVSFLHF